MGLIFFEGLKIKMFDGIVNGLIWYIDLINFNLKILFSKKYNYIYENSYIIFYLI